MKLSALILLPLFAGITSTLAIAQTDQAPANPLPPAYTLKAGTQLVIVDVAVRDKHGNPIHGLAQSDFTLTEGGKPQQIKNFEEHSALTPAQLAAVPAHPPLPPGDFTNLVTTPQTGALNIILFDVLNSAPTNQMYMRAELTDYLKHARPDSRTAIYALTTHLVQLQGFTSDPKLLLAALESKGKPKAAVYRDDLSGGIPNSESNSVAGEFIAHNGSPQAGDFAPSIAALEAPIQEYQQQMRAYTTLDALNLLGRSLTQLPGHKNLIWFAGDFPPEFFPSDSQTSSNFAATGVLDDEFRDTVNLLSRAQVAVYPIDAQGVRSDGSNTAEKANGRYVISSSKTGPMNAAAGGGPIASDSTKELNYRAAEHFSMVQIAQDTGGHAFENSNDLTSGTAKAIEDGANYYTIAYTPTGETAKNGFRSIHVTVAPGKYDLSYRRGYYSDHNSRVSAAVASAPKPTSPLQLALLPGAPQPSEILLRVHAAPTTDPLQPAVLPDNTPNPNLKKPLAGPFRVIEVQTAASVRNMSFTHGADKIIHTKVDFVTDVYSADGTLLNVLANTVNGDYKPEELAELLRTGITFHQRISVPAKGEYFLRVAVHDHNGGHTGAVEIPLDAIANVPPLASVATTSLSSYK